MRAINYFGSCLLFGIIFIFFLEQMAMASPLSMNDVLETTSIDMATLSPDGKEVAVVIQRPVATGEIYGRTAYEIDPSRSDVWLVARDGSGARRVTDGKSTGAGFWCAQWSPNGAHLAMLSTQPEAEEPRGGNSVRLYLWNKGDRSLKRLSQNAMMTQTRYGSPMNALDVRSAGIPSGIQKMCREGDENAPFLWLDDNHVLAVQMALGQNSAIFTQYSRPFEAWARTADLLKTGEEPTADVSASPEPGDATRAYVAEIVSIDITDGSRRLLARVPAYPFDGTLSLWLSPDAKRIAVLAPERVIAPVSRWPFNNSETKMQKRLGVISTSGEGALKWAPPYPEALYPLDLQGWSPDGRKILFRARASGSEQRARFYLLNVTRNRISDVAPDLSSDPTDAGSSPHPDSAIWDSSAGLKIRAQHAKTEPTKQIWWQVGPHGTIRETATPSPQRSKDEGTLDEDLSGIISCEFKPTGTTLVETSHVGGRRELLKINTHLSQVDWGEVRVVDYLGQKGENLKGQLILPPGYDPKRRYPLLVWVYPKTNIRGASGYWTDPYLAGIYNLQLYAAKGYAVLIPSMPLSRQPEAGGPYRQMAEGVLPAVDAVVSLGIADTNRVGLFGQSLGGYAVYSLVTQTKRFRAAAALAGIADLTVNYGAFDTGSNGWTGSAKDKSANAEIFPAVSGLSETPITDPQYVRANSPITYVGNVQTPLLMAHGSLDYRGNIEEAESFFSLLYRQGKPARLLRYGGESHSLADSPANVRNLFDEIVSWFDRYLKGDKAGNAFVRH